MNYQPMNSSLISLSLQQFAVYETPAMNYELIIYEQNSICHQASAKTIFWQDKKRKFKKERVTGYSLLDRVNYYRACRGALY